MSGRKFQNIREQLPLSRTESSGAAISVHENAISELKELSDASHLQDLAFRIGKSDRFVLELEAAYGARALHSISCDAGSEAAAHRRPAQSFARTSCSSAGL